MMSAVKREQQVGLWAAIYRGDVHSASQFFKNGADINDVQCLGANTNSRGTPLHWAACYGRVDMVQLLLSHDADLFSRDNDGRTPEDVAEYNSHFEVATILRRAKLDMVTTRARLNETMKNSEAVRRHYQQNLFSYQNGNTVDNYHQSFIRKNLHRTKYNT
jgi:ankyrin repeat protein